MPTPPSLAGEGLAEMQGMVDEEEQEEDELAGTAHMQAAQGGSGGALQVALPARLDQDPEDLIRIRDGLFSGSRQQPAKQRRVVTVAVTAGAGAGAVIPKPGLHLLLWR